MHITTYHPLAGQAVTLYQSGLGLRTISARLRTPKTSVRRWLLEAGVYQPEKAKEHYEQSLASKPSCDPKRAAHNMRRRLREFLQSKESEASHPVFGCTKSELRAWLESKFRDGMTWQNYGAWHVDHVLPCASFDLSNPEQRRACFNFKNLQPLWAAENRKKGASIIAHESNQS